MKHQAIEKAGQSNLLARPFLGPLLQRKCACGQHTIAGGECNACRDKLNPLRRFSTNQSAPSIVPDAVYEALRTSGEPLDVSTRAFMESRFGHDFSSVRVHTDTRAAESARAVNALAYTVGRDVVFGLGQYAPATGEGQRLLAHELTHFIQQMDHPVANSAVGLHIGPDDSTAESEAHLAATQLSVDASIEGRIGSHPRAVQRQKATGKCSNKAIKNCTDEDLLTAICIGEAGNIIDRDGKRGVMNVVMNRVAEGSFGADIQSVATATGQFRGLSEGIRLLNDESFAGCRPLAQEVMKSPGNDPTAGAVFFNQSCEKPCTEFCTVYLGDGKTRAHYFSRRATELEKQNCKDKKRNPKGVNDHCCVTPKQRVYVLPEVEIIGEKETNMEGKKQ
jgi:hypothetical protein